jgi:hypothetical protein
MHPTEMIRPYDLEGLLHLLPSSQGGRTAPAYTGYRPAHKLYDNYLSSGIHDYPETGLARPGETTPTRVWLITPEVYPGSLWVGRVLDISEGQRCVGSFTITLVCKPILIGEPSEYSPQWKAPDL